MPDRVHDVVHGFLIVINALARMADGTLAKVFVIASCSCARVAFLGTFPRRFDVPVPFEVEGSMYRTMRPARTVVELLPVMSTLIATIYPQVASSPPSPADYLTIAA